MKNSQRVLSGRNTSVAIDGVRVPTCLSFHINTTRCWFFLASLPPAIGVWELPLFLARSHNGPDNSVSHFPLEATFWWMLIIHRRFAAVYFGVQIDSKTYANDRLDCTLSSARGLFQCRSEMQHACTSNAPWGTVVPTFVIVMSESQHISRCYT